LREGRLSVIRLAFALVLVGLVLAASPALAAGPTRVAVLPPRDVGAASARIDAALAEAAQALPGFVVANLAGAKLSGPRKGDARLETQPAARAVLLGKETGASRAVAVEATPLGDGLVVYLQALEVPSGRAVGSTTLSLGGGSARAPGDRDALRAALMRILDPGRYTGRVQLRVDVEGAVVVVDGRPVAAPSVELPVGTHALRVTHPAYHDFLRFLDVEFDKTITVDVNMAAYPLAEGEMSEQQRRALGPTTHKKLPWWRTWWALSLAGVALTGVTVGVVWLARPWLDHGDSSSAFNPMPQP
jgi:PEGA domain-containing protein